MPTRLCWQAMEMTHNVERGLLVNIHFCQPSQDGVEVVGVCLGGEALGQVRESPRILFRFLLQDEVAMVSAFTGNYSEDPGQDPIDVEEIATVHLKFNKGTIVTLHTAYLLPISKSGYKEGIKDSYLAIYGKSGNFVWSQPMSGANTVLMESVHPEFRLKPRQELNYHLPESDAYCGAFGMELLRNFIEAVQTGTSFLATGKDAMKDLQIIEAAYRSAESGKHIKL